MNEVFGIAGLGLIGGSFARAIKEKTDCRVLGYDINNEVISAAKEQGVIDGELTGSIKECSIVLIALYPEETLSFCKENFPLMKSRTIVVDCAGVKSRICAELSAFAKENSVCFVGGHPMAGVERSGFSSSFSGLFNGAVMILCEDENTDSGAIEKLEKFFPVLGFGSVKVTTADEHDEIIAFTSQLAHLVSSAYIHSGALKKRYGFSAGSFKDLIRVAKLNCDMWTKLFFENKDNLLKETDVFLENVRKYRDALALSDAGAMKKLLKKGAELKAADEKEEEKWLVSQKIKNFLDDDKKPYIQINVNTQGGKYPVIIGEDLNFGKLALEIKKICRAVIISDDNVFPLYGNTVAESFSKSGFQTDTFIIKNGEESKNLNAVSELLNFLAEKNITRKDMLVALGGGVAGDITGFASAVYLRGIDFFQLPTTILAAVDSSVGGKTGVDLQSGKNLAGAFHQPAAVFCSTNVFSTLPKNVYADGMAEVIKHGMIADKDMLLCLKNMAVSEMCSRNVKIKAAIVEQDEFDTGVRRLLNFGHTIGHAVETLSNYQISHGSAVSIGMMMITRACEKRRLTESPCLDELKKTLESFGLPVRCDYSAKQLAQTALHDKKRLGQTITLVIPKTVGRAELFDLPVTEFEDFIADGMEE